MDEKEYLEQFGLSSKEMRLHILQCGIEPLKKQVANIETVNPSELTELPFEDQSFDLALCSHVLFLDKEQTEKGFDLKALMELARVAGEVRVFPLVDEEGKPVSGLGPLIQALQQKGFGVELKQTGGAGDASAKKGTALLRLWNESCLLS